MPRYSDPEKQKQWIERLRKSHEKYKGVNNPANRPDVKDKIRNNPNSKKGRFIKGQHPHNYGKNAPTYEPTKRDAEKRKGQKRTAEQIQHMVDGLPENHAIVARERAIANMLLGKWGKNSKHENELERILSQQLGLVKNKDYFHPYRIGNYVFDFYIPSVRCVIETDGREHWADSEIMERDKKKEQFLKEKGYILLRFRDFQIFNKAELVLKKIQEVLG